MFLLLDFLDDTDSDGLLHVTDSETTEGLVVGELLNDHGLLGDELNHSGIAGLDVVGLLLHNLTGTLVDLGADLGELAGNVRSVAIEDGSISVSDLTGMVEDDDLSAEHGSVLGGVPLGVGGDVATLDVGHGETLDVETNVVTGLSLINRLVMHLDGLDLSGHVHGAESGNDTLLESTGLNTADGDCADTGDLVDVLEGKTEGLLRWAVGRVEHVEGLKEVGSLVPGHLLGPLDHVVTNPAGDGDELDLGGVVADLLEVGDKLVLDFLVPLFSVVD